VADVAPATGGNSRDNDGGGSGGGEARHVVDQLSAYLEGELKPRAAEGVRGHLAGCAPCARAADELRAIVASARSLDRPEPPPTLWPAIEGALAADEAPLLAWRGFFVRGLAVGGLAGAALALALVVGWRFWSDRGRGGVDAPSLAASTAPTPTTPAAPAVALDPLLQEAEAELETAAASYEHSIGKLRALLARREEPRWSPDMRGRFLERLALLDEAIERSRAAARSTPGDGAGNEILFAAYRSKIDFLAAVVHRGGPEEMPREGLP
jgi:Putative zinc-finger